MIAIELNINIWKKKQRDFPSKIFRTLKRKYQSQMNHTRINLERAHLASVAFVLPQTPWLILLVGAFLTCRRVTADGGSVESLRNAGNGSGHYFKHARSISNCCNRYFVRQAERKIPSVTRNLVMVEHDGMQRRSWQLSMDA